MFLTQYFLFDKVFYRGVEDFEVGIGDGGRGGEGREGADHLGIFSFGIVRLRGGSHTRHASQNKSMSRQ